MALSWPVDAPVSQYFGDNPNDIQPNGHTGVDFAVAVGTKIYAADSGTVELADWATTLPSVNNKWLIMPNYAGIVVVINHNNGLKTLYAHLSDTLLNAGEFIEKGALVGLSGSTGLSTGPHLHFEVLSDPLKSSNGFYGRLNPSSYCTGLSSQSSDVKVILNDNQRMSGSSAVSIRDYPSLSGKVLGTVPPNTVQTFDGYAVGDYVGDYNVWYKGSDGYVWSGGFTEQSTKGLNDLTYKLLLTPNQRLAGDSPVTIRSYPSTTAKVLGSVPANSIQTFQGYVVGDYVGDYNVWYKGTDGYVWSGGFTEASTRGLANMTSSIVASDPAAPVVPTPAPAPVDPAPSNGYSFTPDFDFVEYIPANINNLIVGSFPDNPAKVVIHQFGTVGKDTITSTINTFTSPNLGSKAVSAHFVVSGKRIVQMVSLKDRAFHAYIVGNDYVGIETDPAQDADTIASTKKLLAALRDKYGYELPKILHRDVPKCATNCGAAIKLSNYDLDPVQPAPTPTPDPSPVPDPTPEPTPTPAPAVDEEAIIDAFLATLKKAYFDSKK